MRTGYNTSLVTSVLKYVQMWVTWLCVYIRDIVCPLINWGIGTPAECEVPKMKGLRAIAHTCQLITAGQINSLSLDAWPHCSDMSNVYGFHDLCVQRLANAWGLSQRIRLNHTTLLEYSFIFGSCTDFERISNDLHVQNLLNACMCSKTWISSS